MQPNQQGLVVQLVRMPPCHGGGRGFEPRPDRKPFKNFLKGFCFYKYNLTYFGELGGVTPAQLSNSCSMEGKKGI